MKEDQGHPQVEQQLRPDPVERVGDEPQHRRPDDRAGGDKQDHLGYPRNRREKLGDQAGAQDEAEVAKYLLYLHGLPFSDEPHEPLRQRPPAKALHAVAAHDLPATFTFLFR